MERKYWYEIQGKRIPDESAMVTKLLDENVLTLGCDIVVENNNSTKHKTLTLFVNCNDVFSWGCCDAEPVTFEELVNLFELYEKNPECGPTQWVCIKRNEQPQLPVVDWLKAHNGWTPELDNLPKNNYDKLFQRTN